jgi:hypothetical protein
LAIFATSNAASSPPQAIRQAITPWDEVYFPFAPHLHTASHLQAIPIARLELEAPWIEERYTCDAHGIIEVEMRNQTSHYACRYHLRGSVRRDHLGVE